MRYIKTFEQFDIELKGTQYKLQAIIESIQADNIRSETNSYYYIRVGLQNLSSRHEKLEYRALSEQMEEHEFNDYFKGNDDTYHILPTGTYAIHNKGGSIQRTLELAEEAIKKALYPYYEVGWHTKYNIVVSGPSELLSRNLELKDKP